VLGEHSLAQPSFPQFNSRAPCSNEANVEVPPKWGSGCEFAFSGDSWDPAARKCLPCSRTHVPVFASIPHFGDVSAFDFLLQDARRRR
jgi:hypothetical protein